jgi:hypothetical protein
MSPIQVALSQLLGTYRIHYYACGRYQFGGGGYIEAAYIGSELMKNKVPKFGHLYS